VQPGGYRSMGEGPLDAMILRGEPPRAADLDGDGSGYGYGDGSAATATATAPATAPATATARKTTG